MWVILVVATFIILLMTANDAHKLHRQYEKLSSALTEVVKVVNLNADSQTKAFDYLEKLGNEHESMRMLVDAHHKILQLPEIKENEEFPTYKPDI